MAFREIREIDKALACLIRELDGSVKLRHLYQGLTMLSEDEVADMLEKQLCVAKGMLKKWDAIQERVRCGLEECIEAAEARLEIHRRGK
jgi:hypothetical protein